MNFNLSITRYCKKIFLANLAIFIFLIISFSNAQTNLVKQPEVKVSSLPNYEIVVKKLLKKRIFPSTDAIRLLYDLNPELKDSVLFSTKVNTKFPRFGMICPCKKYKFKKEFKRATRPDSIVSKQFLVSYNEFLKSYNLYKQSLIGFQRAELVKFQKYRLDSLEKKLKFVQEVSFESSSFSLSYLKVELNILNTYLAKYTQIDSVRNTELSHFEEIITDMLELTNRYYILKDINKKRINHYQGAVVKRIPLDVAEASISRLYSKTNYGILKISDVTEEIPIPAPVANNVRPFLIYVFNNRQELEHNRKKSPGYLILYKPYIFAYDKNFKEDEVLERASISGSFFPNSILMFRITNNERLTSENVNVTRKEDLKLWTLFDEKRLARHGSKVYRPYKLIFYLDELSANK